VSTRPKSQIRPPSGAAAFVGGSSASSAASRPVNQSTSSSEGSTEGSSRRGVVSRKRKGDLDRVTAYLPYELGAELRMRCAGQRIELSEAIAEAVRAWLAR
jgi:hypothetical protein